MILKPLLLRLSKLDTKFKILLHLNEEIEFIKIDACLYQNRMRPRSSKLYCWEELTHIKKRYYFFCIIEKIKVHILVWIDKDYTIHEVEFQILGELSSDNLLEKVSSVEIEKECVDEK